MATKQDPNESTADWTNHTMAERIHSCRMMLVLHGYLTQAESDRVKDRQMKQGMVPADAIIVPRNGGPR